MFPESDEVKRESVLESIIYCFKGSGCGGNLELEKWNGLGSEINMILF